MIDKIDLIEFDKIALSKSETKALKLLQTSNLLLNGESKKELDRLLRLGLAEKAQRYWITTAIAIAALILAGISLAAQLGLIQLPQA